MGWEGGLERSTGVGAQSEGGESAPACRGREGGHRALVTKDGRQVPRGQRLMVPNGREREQGKLKPAVLFV